MNSPSWGVVSLHIFLKCWQIIGIDHELAVLAFLAIDVPSRPVER